MAAGVEAAGHIVLVEEADRQITVQPNCSALLNSGLLDVLCAYLS